MATTSLKSPIIDSDRSRREAISFSKKSWRQPLGDPVPVRQLVAMFGRHVLAYKGALFRAFFAFFSAATLQSMFPMASKFIIDRLIPSENYVLLLATVGVLFVLQLLNTVISTLGQYVLMYTSTHIVFDVRRRLFEHLQLLHLAFYEREQSGKLVSKLIYDASALQGLIQSALPTISVNIFTMFVTLALMLTLNAKLTALSLLVLPAYMAASWYFKNIIYHRSRQLREMHSILSGNVTEVVSGMKVVKSFGMERRENRRIVDMIRENLDYEIDLSATNSVRNSVLNMITVVARMAVIVVGVGAVMGKSMTLGDYIAFTGFLGMLFSPIQAISGLTIQSVTARAGLERVYHILNMTPEVVDRPNARAATKLEGHITLENVTFGYQEDLPVLHGIDLEVKPGEVVALVGPSGSGKTTIVNLLTRFYDPSEGRVLIDGIDLRNLNLRSYRRRVGIVLQESFLFTGTILDNICYGKGQTTYEEVEEAARQANALDFINELSDGMDTQVGERGAMLSGGQRQRIAIARALLKDPDILILDEATSSLDTGSERLVQEALDRLMQGRTVIVIAHRLSTIRNADKIVVLNKGRIVETGSHDELMAANGLYASLYSQKQYVATVRSLFAEDEESAM